MGKNGNADRAGRSTAWARTYKDEKRKAGVRTHLAKRADAGKLSEAQREQQLLQEKREAKEAKAKAFLEQEALWASMYESRVEDQDGDHNEEDQIDDLNGVPTDQCDQLSNQGDHLDGAAVVESGTVHDHGESQASGIVDQGEYRIKDAGQKAEDVSSGNGHQQVNGVGNRVVQDDSTGTRDYEQSSRKVEQRHEPISIVRKDQGFGPVGKIGKQLDDDESVPEDRVVSVVTELASVKLSEVTAK